MASKAHQAAADEVRSMFVAEEEPSDEDAPSGETPAVAQEDEQETAEEDTPEEEAQEAVEAVFAIDVDLPDDIREIVEEPDFEAEAEEELAEEEPDDEEGEYEWSPQLQEERKKRIALEKKLAFVEGQRVKAERKKWEEEAAKFFPLANVAVLDATSRRGFLRAAKADHEAKKPFVMKAVEAERAKLVEERAAIRAEVEAEVTAAWGKPVAAGGRIATTDAEKDDLVDEAFKQKGLRAGIQEMFRQGR